MDLEIYLAPIMGLFSHFPAQRDFSELTRSRPMKLWWSIHQYGSPFVTITTSCGCLPWQRLSMDEETIHLAWEMCR